MNVFQSASVTFCFGLISFFSTIPEASARCQDEYVRLGDAKVTHGSPIERFSTAYRGPLTTTNDAFPSGPSWFALDNIDFSIHAALRFVDQNTPAIFLHQYQGPHEILVKRCDNAIDFDAHLRSDASMRAHMDERLDQKQNALIFCAMQSDPNGNAYHGILLDEDLVREEAELILCYPSRNLYSRNVRFRYETYLQNGFQCARRRYTLGGREMYEYWALNMNVLTDLRKNEAAIQQCQRAF